MKKLKRAMACILAGTLLFGNAFDSLASSGYEQFHGAPAQPYIDRTFMADAQSQIDKDMMQEGYWTATGLAEEMTSTLRARAPKGLEEPIGYGKWWYRAQGNVGIIAIPYSLDKAQKINVDFRKFVRHYNSCIQNHAANEITSTETSGVTYISAIGYQAFADAAYLPVTGAYPDFINRNGCAAPVQKFQFLLMSLLHANHEIPDGAEWDSDKDTSYSMLLYCLTRVIESGGLKQGIASSAEADLNEIYGYARNELILRYLNPNSEGHRLTDTFISDQEVRNYFLKWWKAAAFLTYFNYGIADGSSSGGSSGSDENTTGRGGGPTGAPNGGGSTGSGSSSATLETGVTITMPLSETTPYAGGGYERHFDYVNGTAEIGPVPQRVYDYFTNLTAKIPSGSNVKFTKNGSWLIFSAPTAEELSDSALGNIELLLGEDGSTYREESEKMAPGGLVSMKSISVSQDLSDLAIGEGQLRFCGYTLPFKATPGTYSGGGSTIVPTPTESSVVRYKHSETFQADYNINLRKFDSETGKGLKDSHFDILEAFPDADGQLGKTKLEASDNWGNDDGSQFTKWDGWDYGAGNPDGDQANDPCNIDNDVTDTNGLLKYAAGTGTAHTDTKTYNYVKGFCGGHPAKPEPEVDEETGEILNQDEIDAWEKDVETCKKLIEESNTGFFCATAENGYESGEDADGSLSKKEMEDDRDARYAEFISLTYDYSAKEIKARDGYIIHDLHTDDIPIETKTVTSSQYKDFNDTCGGDAANLPHTDSQTAGGGSTGGGTTDPDEGGDEGGDEDNDYDNSYEEYDYTGTITSITSSKIKIKGDDGKTHSYDTADIYDMLSDEDIEHLSKGCRVSITGIIAQDEEYIETFEFSTDPNAYKTSKNSVGRARFATKKAVVQNSVADTNKNADVYTSTLTSNAAIATVSEMKPMDDADGAAYEEYLNEDLGEDTFDEDTFDEEDEEIDDKDEDDSEYSSDDFDDATASEIEIERATDSNLVAVDSENAVQKKKVNWINTIVQNVQDAVSNFVEMCGDKIRYTISLFSDDEDEGDENGGSGAHPVRDSVTWTPDGPGNYVEPLKSDIVDHTFTVFDHRTEGEIHVNKRDLDLKAKEAGQYDAYANENADGSLEGAVYGLFAKSDIIHPDGHTDVVYQKDDLVAIATTDRNGDASFMTFTEAPGSTYDYKQGKVVKRTDSPFDGADNLHKDETDGDAVSQDNEAYIGYNSNNQEVTLKDSQAGDNTVYYKHSSNQNGIEGLTGGHETYPISNNEKNNGNCWIGRPLIANPNGSNYYIKELSRSEGYELSVTGKANDITNGKDSENTDRDEQMVTVGGLSEDSPNNGWSFNVVGKNLTGDVHISATSGEGAEFVSTSLVEEPCEIEVEDKTEVKTPVIGVKDTQVILNGSPVEASIGDKVTVNGTTYTVTNVSEKEEQTMGAIPSNTMMLGLPDAATYHSANVADFVTKYNNALLDIGYRTPDANAPWIRVKLSGTTDTDWIAILSSALKDYGLIAFNRVRITDTVTNTDGSTSLIIRYDYASKKTPDNCVYNTDQDALYVKQDSGNGYFIYVKVPADSQDVISVSRNKTGFVTSAILKKFTASSSASYPNALPAQDGYQKTYTAPVSYWLYDGTMQQFNYNGTLATTSTWVTSTHKEQSTRIVEHTENLQAEYKDGKYMVTIPKNLFGNGTTGQVTIRMQAHGDNTNWYYKFNKPLLTYVPVNEDENSYIETATLSWKNEKTIVDDADTGKKPLAITERPIRQSVKISKDINTLPETLKVWYCANCGTENDDNSDTCANCGRKRTVEATKSIDFMHDTYAAFFNEDLSKDKQNTNWIERAKNWFKTISGVQGSEDTSKAVPNFRFKAYLKSNIERLYRNEDGQVLWVDRNGNRLTPVYKDVNGDGLYDTFEWQTVDGTNTDFPEVDKETNGAIESTNVQKIYTEVQHNEKSMTTSGRANNVWSSYQNPSETTENGIAEKDHDYTYSTNERIYENNPTDPVNTNESLYSYVGTCTNVGLSDKINEDQNPGYTRLLEMTGKTMENGAGKTLTIDSYNYEKFFDALNAANTDKWDDDIDSCTFKYNGYDTPVGKISMQAYPGQHWEDTLKEENQKGDTNTSFDLFRWIHQKIHGSVTDYEKYKGDLNGENIETETSTSDYARANAEASNVVRQFAVKWYLQDEVAKLVKNNGVGDGEDVAKTEADGGAPGITEEGVVPYDDYIHDYALFKALEKAYNYLRPFYENDLDTIYSVTWDSAENGGNDKDVTTLSTDSHEDGAFYNTSAYLPYGTYVIVEQTPENSMKETGYDLVNRAFNIEKPKEVIVPSVYDGAASNDTTDNYDTHYNFDPEMTMNDMAASVHDGKEGYLIRFGEEWQNNGNGDNEHVIRAHGYDGDYEVFKYGLNADKLGQLTGNSILSNSGEYAFKGFTFAQSIFDPLKDYYAIGHAGESKDGTRISITEKEGGQGTNEERFPIGELPINKEETANGTTYDVNSLINRFNYASVSEDNGNSKNVLYKGGTTDDNNVSGMQFKDARSVTGQQTAYEGKYASMLVPWSVVKPADMKNYSSEEFAGCADVNERNTFKTATLTIRKVDAETGEQILHDDTTFGIYAASRYDTEEEIMKDAEKLSGGEKTKFVNQFKPGDTKFYLEDTKVYGSREFLEAMGAYDIDYLLTLSDHKAKRYQGNGYEDVSESKIKDILGKDGYTTKTGTVEYGIYHYDILSGTSLPDDEKVTWYYSVYNTDSPLCIGTIPKGTPICSEKNAVILQDDFGNRTGMLKSYSTMNDVLMENENKAGTTGYHLQNTGYMRTPQPLGSGCYVVAELKTPYGYLRAKPEAHELYSGVDYYYEGGDMFKKTVMVDYQKRIDKMYSYEK